MEFILRFFEELIKITNEMAIYLLLGFLFAGILHVLVPKDKITKYLGKNNFLSVVNASVLGVPLPLCSCGVIPTGISFYRNGASRGAAVSFLISTPQTGVDSMLVTYSMLGLPFAILRPFIAFVTGIFGGVLANKIAKNDTTGTIHTSLVEEEAEMTGHWLKRMMKYAFVDFMQDLSKWLIIGLVLAALISTFIPNNFFTGYIGNDLLSMFIILLISVPLYICATSSVPIAAMLMMKGLSPGAALVFLMAGPATNAATMTVIGKVLGKRTLLVYLTSIISGAIVFGLLIDYVLPSSWFIVAHVHGAGHNHDEMFPMWLQVTMSILLILLIINGYIQKYLQTKNLKPLINLEMDNNQIVLSVKGMSCNHCQANVEKNVAKIQGIKTIKANHVSSQVVIEGQDVNLDEVKKVVEMLGYEYVGKL